MSQKAAHVIGRLSDQRKNGQGALEPELESQLYSTWR